MPNILPRASHDTRASGPARIVSCRPTAPRSAATSYPSRPIASRNARTSPADIVQVCETGRADVVSRPVNELARGVIALASLEVHYRAMAFLNVLIPLFTGAALFGLV